VAFRLREGTDKLTQFQRFKDAKVSSPDFTTDRAVAADWCRAGSPVVCRTLLRGSEGRGIVVAELENQLVQAPLYTRYVKKKKEFRVHVLNGKVIDVQEKRKQKDFPDDPQRDIRIRNLANGFVFCREDVREPDGLRRLALEAVQALGYTLGAVDVVFNERLGVLYVLEVNSTPGMEGTTLQKYADEINLWYKEQA
jgi:D-alanine-D-alanine ligase-like ATP-grasp enzyme